MSPCYPDVWYMYSEGLAGRFVRDDLVSYKGIYHLHTSKLINHQITSNMRKFWLGSNWNYNT